MELQRYRSWRVVIYWEKLAGFWPYQNKIHNNVIRTWLYILPISFFFPLGASLVEEFGINFEIVVENFFGLMLAIVMIAKVTVAVKFQKNRKEVYDKIFNHIDTMRDPEEAEILKEHYDYGLQYSFRYAVTMVLLGALHYLFHFGKVAFDYFFNGSNTIQLIPYHLEYFVDEAKYFYYIMTHIIVCTIGFLIVIFTFDCAFIMQVQHICALFKIVKRRLMKTLNWETKGDIILYISMNKNTEVYNCISSAVDLHLEVLEMVNSIEKIYNVCWFIVLVENTIAMGAGLYILYSYAHDFFIVAKYLTVFIATCIHFYVIFDQGQKIIDSSLSVYNACYDTPWYNWNKKLRQMLMIMMARCKKPCQITGGSVFVMSMETYWKMMKTGLSCYTLCKIREDFA